MVRRNNFTVGNPVHRRYDLESLEPRLLLSADGLGVGMVHETDDDFLAKHEVVLEVVEDIKAKELRKAGVLEKESIFGDFEVEVSFGDEGNGELCDDDPAGQDGADSEVIVLAVETVPNVDEAGRHGDSSEQNADADTVQIFTGGVVPDGAADQATTNGLEGSGNPIPAMLTETLRNANAPPADQAVTGTPGGE